MSTPIVSKHDFAHIETYIRGRLRILSSDDELPIFNGYVTEGQNIKEVMSKTDLPRELIDFLSDMSLKLDHIVSVLEHNKLEESFPVSIDTSSISAAEILFKTEYSLPNSCTVEVILPLGHMPFKIAGGIGQVKKISENEYSFLFTKIKEQDLENIIQFVFQQERRRIREVRWS